MSSIKVYMDNYNNICYPGQTIAGRIECVFDEEKKFRAIRIKFRGRAKTEWNESERYYDHSSKQHRSRSVRYYGEEDYFNAEYILVQGGDNVTIPAGKHTYPFSYILPAHLPSSYEGGYGNIRYYVQGVVDRPWKFDYEDKFLLNLASPLDLNYIQGLREPIAQSVDKTMCSCWCNDSGALTFNMSLPASGFASDQEVNIGAHIENLTNVNVENVKFKIVADIEYITHYPSIRTRFEENVIAECVEGGVGAHGEKSWTTTLRIPRNDNIPNLIPSNIINIGYRLKAKVIVPCPHSNLENEVPMMIGSIPLAGVATGMLPGPPPPQMMPFSGAPIGEASPLLPGGMPFPMGGDAPPYPYPSNDGKYPMGGGTGVAYPPGEKNPTAPGMSYPSAPNGSFASGNAPYPPEGGPYPAGPGGINAPYPPSAGGMSTPYPPGGMNPGGAPYPSGGSSSAPYPPAQSSSSTPYPPGGATAPYPPANSGWSQEKPQKDESDFVLPSYDDAKTMHDKSGRPM